MPWTHFGHAILSRLRLALPGRSTAIASSTLPHCIHECKPSELSHNARLIELQLAVQYQCSIWDRPPPSVKMSPAGLQYSTSACTRNKLPESIH
jgi:hypothetical protein